MLLRTPAHTRRACSTTDGARRARGRGPLLAGAAVLVAVLASAPAPSPAATPVAATLRVLAVTPVVTSPGGLLGVTLARTGALAAHGATVQLTLFGQLTTRFGLDDAIGAAGPGGAVSTTRLVAASCLPGGAAVRAVVGLAPIGAKVHVPKDCGRPAPVLRMLCAAACDGVYPLEVTVRGGGAVASRVLLVTFGARARTPLRVVWVLRVAGQQGALVAAAPALAPLASRPLVPVTVDVQGQAIADGLAQPGTTAAIAALRGAVASAHHELIGEAYVPADLGALEASRLGLEVLRQFALTRVALLTAGVTTAPDTTVSVASGPPSPTAAHAAASVGVHHLLVPGTDLVLDPTDTLTWGSTFLVSGDATGPTVLAADTELSSLAADSAADPAVAANEFLGELSFLHFEQPNLAQPRAVVVLTHATRSVAPAFVRDVLAGLSSSPVLEPVTASSAFSTVPVGANGFPGVRPMATPPARPWPTALVDTLRALRRQTDALSSAVVPGPATPVPAIEGQLLSAERDLPASGRAPILSAVHRALVAQLSFFRFYSGPITLTATGSTTIPITVLSSAPYGVTGVIQLTSPRIAFARHDYPFTFNGNVYTFRVPARALVNGDLPLSVVLFTPKGRLVLARAMITVRVTGFSVVGIALTVLAILVLAGWWLRTLRRRRSRATTEPASERASPSAAESLREPAREPAG